MGAAVIAMEWDKKQNKVCGDLSSGPGWAKLSWCTLVLGKGNSASAIHSLTHVQEGIRRVCILSVQICALLELEHCRK